MPAAVVLLFKIAVKKSLLHVIVGLWRRHRRLGRLIARCRACLAGAAVAARLNFFHKRAQMPLETPAEATRFKLVSCRLRWRRRRRAWFDLGDPQSACPGHSRRLPFPQGLAVAAPLLAGLRVATARTAAHFSARCPLLAACFEARLRAPRPSRALWSDSPSNSRWPLSASRVSLAWTCASRSRPARRRSLANRGLSRRNRHLVAARPARHSWLEGSLKVRAVALGLVFLLRASAKRETCV